MVKRRAGKVEIELAQDEYETLLGIRDLLGMGASALKNVQQRGDWVVLVCSDRDAADLACDVAAEANHAKPKSRAALDRLWDALDGQCPP